MRFQGDTRDPPALRPPAQGSPHSPSEPVLGLNGDLFPLGGGNHLSEVVERFPVPHPRPALRDSSNERYLGCYRRVDEEPSANP